MKVIYSDRQSIIISWLILEVAERSSESAGGWGSWPSLERGDLRYDPVFPLQ